MNQTTLQGKRGVDLLRDPEFNKSTAFTEAEKQELGIEGLVPDLTETEDVQLSRVLLQLSHKTTDLDRYIYLVNLLDHNETLFYRTVMLQPVVQYYANVGGGSGGAVVLGWRTKVEF